MTVVFSLSVFSTYVLTETFACLPTYVICLNAVKHDTHVGRCLSRSVSLSLSSPFSVSIDVFFLFVFFYFFYFYFFSSLIVVDVVLSTSSFFSSFFFFSSILLHFLRLRYFLQENPLENDDHWRFRDIDKSLVKVTHQRRFVENQSQLVCLMFHSKQFRTLLFTIKNELWQIVACSCLFSSPCLSIPFLRLSNTFLWQSLSPSLSLSLRCFSPLSFFQHRFSFFVLYWNEHTVAVKSSTYY